MLNNKRPTKAGEGYAGNKTRVIYGFDRITLWIDHTELPGGLKELKKHCTKIEVLPSLMRFHPRWKCKIDIFQPTEQCLGLLVKALGNNITEHITNVEIACDFPAISKSQAKLWRNMFLESARMKGQSQCVLLDEEFRTTYYYGRRTDESGNKRGNVLAVYADKASKIHNARPLDGTPPCLHLDWRANGYAAVVSHGIAAIQDLLKFDHQGFWKKNILMYELPKQTELGRLLARAAGTDLDVSGSALRDRARRFKEANENNYIGNKFIMHNMLLGRSDIVRRLHPMSFYKWAKQKVR